MSAPEARIVTVWDRRDGGPVPPDAAAIIVAVTRCTACEDRRVEYIPEIRDHTDPWKHHFDYCDGGVGRDTEAGGEI